MEKINGVSHLLLVDDSADNQALFNEALRITDVFATCQFANNGLEALTILQNAKTLPDIIFLDLRMPRMDGKTCLQEIRKNERYSVIPVIIYYTYGDEPILQEIKDSGANYFLPKSNSFDALCDSLKLLLTKKWKVKEVAF